MYKVKCQTTEHYGKVICINEYCVDNKWKRLKTVVGNSSEPLTDEMLTAFIEKRVTLARAAELAGKSLAEFIDILSKYNIPWMEYTEETFKEDQEVLEELSGITND